MYEVNLKTTTTAEAEQGSPGYLAEELMKAWNAHDLEHVMSLYDPEYEGVDVGQARPEHGLDGKRQAVISYLLAFPDLHFNTEKLVIEGDTAVVSWTVHGTHRGMLMNIPPTGRSVNLRGVFILSAGNGKISRAVYVWDVAAMLRDIGLLPEL